MKLFNGRRRLVQVSKRRGKQAESIVATLNQGTYFVEVRFMGRQGNSRYNLRAAISPAEPGETTSTARNLGLLAGEYRTRDFVGTNDLLDYYKFNLSQISNFNATINGLTATAIVDLYLDANNNGQIDNGEEIGSGRNGIAISRALLPGTYFLKVNASGGLSTQYDLLLSATPDPNSLPSDPGNGTSTAFDLGTIPNTTIQDFVGTTDPVDYYKFTLTQISDFIANVDGLTETVLIDLYFDANNSGQIDDSERLTGGRDGIPISRTLPPGTYFLVANTFSNATTRYDLSLSTTPNPGNLPVDPGNVPNRAYNLGNFVGTQILKDFVGDFDRFDYYRFSVDAPLTFTASIDGLSQTAQANLYLDANGNGLIDPGERLERGRDGVDIARTLEAGVYFVRVSTFSNSTQYDLTLGSALKLSG